MDGMFQDVTKLEYEKATYYIGHARAIKNLYDHMLKDSVYIPLYYEAPKFNMNRIYGLEIDLENRNFFIISETDACYALMGEIERLRSPEFWAENEMED